MNDYWEFYKTYSKRKKGSQSHIEFRQITCAIDYGKEIINWYRIIDDNLGNETDRFDPIGAPIDRCFRISNLAGPGQLLVSEDFYNKIPEEERKKKEEGKEGALEKISLAKDSLKGFPNETHVYYVVPPEEQIDHILDDSNVELVEKAKNMTTKAKIKLLRIKKKELEQKTPEN